MKPEPGRVVDIAQILYKYVPRQLIERPKQGFAFLWMRGCRPAARMVETLLNARDSSGKGFFNFEPIRKKMGRAFVRRRNWQYICGPC